MVETFAGDSLGKSRICVLITRHLGGTCVGLVGLSLTQLGIVGTSSNNRHSILFPAGARAPHALLRTGGLSGEAKI
jgi:hypothetical protein